MCQSNGRGYKQVGSSTVFVRERNAKWCYSQIARGLSRAGERVLNRPRDTTRQVLVNAASPLAIHQSPETRLLSSRVQDGVSRLPGTIIIQSLSGLFNSSDLGCYGRVYNLLGLPPMIQDDEI